MSAERIRVGIIGTGRVGVDWHLPDIGEAGGEVTALADAVPGRAARHAERLGVRHAFDDYRELIEYGEVDAVAICTPPVAHEEIALAVAQTGKPVYLEKPPAMNAAEMGRIADAVREAGQIMMVGSNSVYFNDTAMLKRYLDDGLLGQVYHVEAFKVVRSSYKMGWHRKKSVAGGGVGMDSSPHRLDLILYLLDEPEVASVTARTFHHFVDRPMPEMAPVRYKLMDVEEGVAKNEEVDVEDTIVALIQFANGCTVMLRDMAGAHMRDELYLKLYGMKGGARWPELEIFGETPNGLPADTRPQVPESPEGAHVLAYRHFFECIRKGCQTQSPPERAVRVMRLVDAIYASAAAGGREVRFDG